MKLLCSTILAQCLIDTKLSRELITLPVENAEEETAGHGVTGLEVFCVQMMSSMR